MIVQLTQFVAINPDYVRAVMNYEKEVCVLWVGKGANEMRTVVNKQLPKEQHLTVQDVVRLLNRKDFYQPSSPAFPQDAVPHEYEPPPAATFGA